MRSRSQASAGSASTIPSSTCGWRLWKTATACGHQGGAGALEATRAAGDRRAARRCRQLLLGGVEPREDRLGVGHQRAPGVREPHAARAALHQPGAGLALQGGHVLADGRLGEVERLGGGGERAPLGDLAKHLHATDVEH